MEEEVDFAFVNGMVSYIIDTRLMHRPSRRKGWEAGTPSYSAAEICVLCADATLYLGAPRSAGEPAGSYGAWVHGILSD